MGIIMRLVVEIVAGWLAGYIRTYGMLGEILVATLRAVVLVTIVRVLRRV